MKKNNSKKAKENPIMMDDTKEKSVKINKTSDDQNEFKSFITIIVIIAVLIGIIYGVTELFKDDTTDPDENVVAGEVNYDKVSIGTLLNRPYDNYYVLLYNSNDENAVLYSTIMTKYMQNSENKDYIKIYYCDLANTLNSGYYNIKDDDKSNPNAKTIEELDLGDLTLIKVEKGKITKYIENYDSIKELLK